MKFFTFILFFILSQRVFAENTQDQNEPQQKQDESTYSNRFLWLPIVYYTPETSLAAGLLTIKNMGKEKEGKTSSVLSSASVTLNGQVLLSTEPRFYFQEGKYESFGNLKYRYYPDKYYGKTWNLTQSIPDKYTERFLGLGFGQGWNFYSNFYVKIILGYHQRSISDFQVGSWIETETLNYSNNFEVPYWGFSLDWDTRDFPQAPKEGLWYRVLHQWHYPKDRSQSKSLLSFFKADVDLRQYFRVREDSTFAIQVLYSNVIGSQIPFQYLNYIGGSEKLRGFYAGRFRDRALALFQTEYRYEFSKKWTLAGFLGYAKLAEGAAQLSSAFDYASAGFGFHYFMDPENRTKIRIDVGFAQSPGVYLTVGEAI